MARSVRRHKHALIHDDGDRWRFVDAILLGRIRAGSLANDRAPALSRTGAPASTAAETH